MTFYNKRNNENVDLYENVDVCLSFRIKYTKLFWIYEGFASYFANFLKN